MSGGQWRPDPSGRFEYRWWDNDHFTEWVATAGEQQVDPAPVPDAPPTVEVGFGSPERQNRWTVGFRFILAIPHFLWLFLVSVAAFFLIVVGWFAALFTARLPTPIARFLHRVLRYQVRVFSYALLMRDEYPPFRLSNDTYPVHLDVNPPRLNRWAVLFRLVLVFPVYLLSTWVTSGVYTAMVVIWIIVLAKGRMPGIVAQAVGAAIRFEARVYGFTVMLTSAYPSGLYGDRSRLEEELAGGWAPEATALPAAPPRTAKLYLSRGARRLVTLFLVLGIVFSVANNVASFRAGDTDSTMGTARVGLPRSVEPTTIEPAARAASDTTTP